MDLEVPKKPSILLLMDQKQNRQLLANWLQPRYNVIEGSNNDDLHNYFDLAIVDGMALKNMREAVLTRRRQEEPLNLPVLLVTSKQAQVNPGLYELWEVADEIINLPVDRLELSARIEILLRVRRLSLELAASKAELSSEVKTRQATQKAFQQLQNNFHVLVESNLIAFVITDKESYILEANDAFLKLVDVTREEVIKGEITLRGLTPPEYLDVFDFRLQLLSENQLNQPYQKEYLRRDGRRVKVFGAGCLVDGPANEYYIGFAVDLTEQIKLEQELIQLNEELENKVRQRTIEYELVNRELQSEISRRIEVEEDLRTALDKEKELSELKSRFVSITSHEFRTPLTTILTNSELLEHYSQKFSESKKQELFGRIKVSVQHMVKLLDDILMVGKAEAGKLEFNPQPLNLETFCRELIEEFDLQQTSRLNFSFSQNSINAWPVEKEYSVDPKLMRHILTNLLSNAFKYSPPSSSVNFSVDVRDTEVIFGITDQGIGIPIEDQSHLFEPFHRAQNIGVIPGTGLGLSIVKQAADLHGATIQFKSVPGKETVFVVSLPLHTHSASQNLMQ